MANVDTSGSLACDQCDRKFKSKQALSSHKTRTHGKGKKSHNRRASSNGRKGKQAQSENLTQHVHYIFGKVETIIEYYASVNGVPRQALAEGVARLLQH